MIDRFINDNEFLSNFYPLPHPSVEHHYQAAKTDDPVLKAKIMNAARPHEAKALGGKVPLRKDWEQVKTKIMEDLVRWKFSDPVMAGHLVRTGDQELMEGNYHRDAIWGCVQKDGQWVGENRLGKILMKIRAEVRKKGAP